MTNENKKFWDGKHFEPDELAKMSHPSAFVKYAMHYFRKRGKTLELGAGTGSDAIFLEDQGFQVAATDLSQLALDQLVHIASGNSQIEIKQFNLSHLFPFEEQSFDSVYAHLSLHYFDKKITQQIFDEVFRILKPGGIVAVLLNSLTDPEYGQGKKLEEDFFYIPNVGTKRYFSVTSLKPFVTKFEEVVLDDKGSDPRRNHKESLIRFIGRRL